MADDKRFAATGDKAFGHGALPADLIWVDLVGRNQGYIDGFHAAATALIDRIAADTSSDAPFEMTFPVLFLYRQYLELQLKAIVKNGCQLTNLAVPPKLLTGHFLSPLWEMSEKIYRELNDADPSPDLKAVGEVIQEFHAIDATGQEFRYEVTTRDTKSLANLPRAFSLIGLRTTMEGVYNSLYSYAFDISALLEGQS